MMMHGFFKLVALATINVLIAIGLSTILLSGGGVPQHLTEDNVSAFIRQVSDMQDGKSGTMDHYDVANFLTDHLADNSLFKSTIRYAVPNGGDQEKNLAMDKKAFIADILQGVGKMQRHESMTKIEYVKIGQDGRTATAVVTNYERGIMAMSDPNTGEDSQIPVNGTSFCQQSFALNAQHGLQMTGADCTTDMSVADSY